MAGREDEWEGGWMGGREDGWEGERMDGRKDGREEGKTGKKGGRKRVGWNGRMEEERKGQEGRGEGGREEGWEQDGREGGWKGGRMEEERKEGAGRKGGRKEGLRIVGPQITVGGAVVIRSWAVVRSWWSWSFVQSSFVVHAWFFVCPLIEGDMAPACCLKKGAGETDYTAHLMDGDDEMHHHRLNDVARPLTCQVVTSTAIVRPFGW